MNRDDYLSVQHDFSGGHPSSLMEFQEQEAMQNTSNLEKPFSFAFSALVLVSAGFITACGPTGTEGDAGSEPTASIVFSEPRNNNVAYTAADDENSAMDGIQITVEVTYNGDDSELSLDVESGGESESYTASASGNTVTFADVTLTSGDPAVANTLTVSATDADAAVRDVTALVPGISPAPSCSFTAPTDGSTVEDANADIDGIQIATEVHCEDNAGNALSGENVQIFATGADVADEVLDAAGNASAVIATPDGATGTIDLTVRLRDELSVSATITVTLPAPQVDCDATITSPADGAAFGSGSPDADGAQAGFQTTVTVQTDVSCDGGTVTLAGGDADVSGTLGGGGTAGVVDIVVTLVDGSNALSATATLDGTTGTAGTATVTYTTPVLAGVAFDITGAEDCGTLGDACLNAADVDADGASETYEVNVLVSANAISAACPFDPPVLSVDTVAVANTATWALNGTTCDADFGAVTVYADQDADAVVVALSTTISAGDVSQPAAFDLGIDRVLPYVNWFVTDNQVFGIADDLVAGGNINVQLSAGVFGMLGSSLEFLEGTNVIGNCTPAQEPDNCSQSLDVIDGTYNFSAQGTDQAGNVMLPTSRNLTFDSTRPCLESITLSGSADLIVNAAEGNTHDVTVNIGAACALEDGQTITLTSDTAGELGSAAASGNGITFSGVVLIEGTQTWTVTATDAARNDIDTASNTAVVVVDTAPPTCAIVAPSAATLLAAADLAPGTADLQVDFQITSDGTALVFSDNTLKGASEPVSGGALTTQKTLTQGAHVISLSCSDDAGNTTLSSDYNVFVDSIAPTLLFNPPESLGSANDTDAGTIGVQVDLLVTHGELEPGQVIEIYLADAQGQPTGAVLGSLTVATGSAGTTLAVNVPTSLLDCADCRYVAVTSDTNGNTAVSSPAAIVIDSGIYSGTFVNPDGGNDPMSINISVDKIAGGAAQVSVVVDTTAPNATSTAILIVDSVPGAPVFVNGGQAAFPQVTLAASGTLEVTFHNESIAKSGTTGERSYVVDLAAPTLAWVTPALEDAPIAFTFNAPEGGSVAANDTSAAAGYQQSVVLNVQGCAGQEVDITSGGTSVVVGALPIAATDNEASFSVPVSIPDGNTQTLVASCTDDAGNPATSDITGSVDTQIPGTPSTFTATVTDHARGNVNLVWEVPGDDGFTDAATLESFSMKDTGAVNDDNFDTLAQDAAATDLALSGTAGATPTAALTGFFFGNTYRFALRATDDLGNVGGVVNVTASPALLSRVFTQPDDANKDDLLGLVINMTPGDLNNDGQNDLVFSANDRGTNCTFGFCNGEVYILYGEADTTDLQAATLQTIAGTVGGETLGYALDIVRSVDGDGIDDLLVNSYANGSDMNLFSGADNEDVSASTTSWTTEAFTILGRPVTGIGDVNGDTFNDFILGQNPGGVRGFEIAFGDGSAPAASQNYSANTLKNVTLSNPNSDGAASSTAIAVGDVTGDNIDDFVVSYTDTSTGPTGEIYLVAGRADWGNAAAAQDLNVTEATGFTQFGSGEQKTGAQLSVGDINGDGDLDVVGVGNGRAQVWLGDGSGLFTPAYFLFNSVNPGALNKLARGGSIVGDLNGDGFDDVAMRGDQGVDVFFGDARETGTRNEPDTSLVLGLSQGEYVIGRPGDLNGDGADDLAVGLASANSLWILFAP
ncbi:MAG: VCBS repeat-containing protein [Deltaproteobacteria bacterium]|nr:VCBS repeat-containing protein [Deltaproteobacteria bacterium]